MAFGDGVPVAPGSGLLGTFWEAIEPAGDEWDKVQVVGMALGPTDSGTSTELVFTPAEQFAEKTNADPGRFMEAYRPVVGDGTSPTEDLSAQLAALERSAA